MKIEYPSGLRPYWFDRNPSSPNQSYYATSIPPHAFTYRYNYLVPAGRHAVVASVFYRIYRRTAATTPGEMRFVVQIWNGSFWADMTDMMSISNTVSTVTVSFYPLQALLLEGHRIAFATTDPSTGGTLDIVASAIITEFDAQ